jgi:hypothetical protein
MQVACVHVRIDQFYSSKAASVHIAKFVIKPNYSEQVDSDLRHRIITKSSRASTSALASMHPRLLLVHHAGLSSPTPDHGHHHRQPSTSTNFTTSPPPPPFMVIVNANKTFYFFYKRRRATTRTKFGFNP